MFGPYTPLQQLDILADFGTKSYVVGSTNSLLLQQKDRYSDILINLDEGTINITSPSLRAALQLSTPDRRWIDFITQNVNDTWDDANPSRPKTMGYVGSEEFIRVQFEEYLLSLLSSVKYRAHLAKYAHNPRMLLPEIEGDPSHDFGPDFIDAWSRTENYRIWNTHTDSHLFDIVEPKHPCAGGLTIDDIQRRITQQVQDLHWDERFAQGKEVLGRNLAAGKEKASTLLNKLYADVEARREAQRKRTEEARAAAENGQQQQHQREGEHRNGGGNGGAVDLAKAQQTMQTVGSKAGAYVNSLAAWGKAAAAGWGRSSSSSNSNSNDNSPSPTTATSSGGGWTSGWGKSSKSSGGSNRTSQTQAQLLGRKSSDSTTVLEKEARLSGSSAGRRTTTTMEERRPLNRDSRGSMSGESMLDGVGPDSALSSPRDTGRPAIDGVLETEDGGRGSVNGNGNGIVRTTEKDSRGEKDQDTDAVGLTVRGKKEEQGKAGDTSAPPTPMSMSAATAEAEEAQKAWDR